ncbi:MAG: hypothetical protein MJ149_01495 [Clostridia bacterium]|nr:hypothetical protein [Clostridia bacterium]
MNKEDKAIEYRYILSNYIKYRDKLCFAIKDLRHILEEKDMNNIDALEIMAELQDRFDDSKKLLKALNENILTIIDKGEEEFNPSNYKLDIVIESVQNFVDYVCYIKNQLSGYGLEDETNNFNELN